jgi:hypothetical protein
VRTIVVAGGAAPRRVRSGDACAYTAIVTARPRHHPPALPSRPSLWLSLRSVRRSPPNAAILVAAFSVALERVVPTNNVTLALMMYYHHDLRLE